MQVPNHLQLYGYNANLIQAPYMNQVPRLDMSYALLSLQQNMLNQQNALKYYIQQQQNRCLNAYNTPNKLFMQVPTQQVDNKFFEEDARLNYLRNAQQQQQQQNHYLIMKEEFGRINQNLQAHSDEECGLRQTRVKSEDTNVSESKEAQIDNYVLSSGCPTTLEESASEEEDDREDFKIIRRGGFKNQRRSNKSDDDESYEGTPRKSNKLIEPKRPPSKAKHLWINYGRKIIDYAVNQTKDEVQNRVKQLIGRLSSKKDFEDVFGVNDEDSEEDKTFKVTFGKLALVFVNSKAEAAFEGSKYRDQMITQKKVVSSWISKLIKE